MPLRPLRQQPTPAPAASSLFRSFLLGGFECSTHRRIDGRRLDLVAETRHDRLATGDYERLRDLGIRTAREGIRWHLIESRKGHYDFSSVAPIVEAARATRIEVIWDLCHYGWPDHLDLWSPAFVDSLAGLAGAFASWLEREGSPLRFFVPVNEISFLSWAAGEVGAFFPYARGRGSEVKRQLVRAALSAIDAAHEVSSTARVVYAEPVINVVAAPRRPQDRTAAEAYRQSQFEATDMLAGRAWPELGGHPRYLDIVGLNYYHDNQWYLGSGRKIRPGHRDYRLLRDMLLEWHHRYGRPLLIAETGIEDAARPRWLRFVCREVDAAVADGARIEGVCLYPIVNHPGWTNDRHCHNGLWDYADANGRRRTYEPLARELRRQLQAHAAQAHAGLASEPAREERAS